VAASRNNRFDSDAHAKRLDRYGHRRATHRLQARAPRREHDYDSFGGTGGQGQGHQDRSRDEDDATGEIAATTIIVGVHIDAITRKARPLPDDIRARADLMVGHMAGPDRDNANPVYEFAIGQPS
jgi:hypothetical protein